MPLSDLPAAWRELAADLEGYAPAAALAWRTAANELETALQSGGDDELNLAAAAECSGYSTRTLREKIASGEIPNVGRKHAPRVRRGDLPKKTPRKTSGYDPAADAMRIVGRAS